MNGKIIETLGKIGLVPLAVLDDAGTAVPLAKALQAGGGGTMEITFRTACARDAIAAVKQQVPGFIPGRGPCCRWNRRRKPWKPERIIL